MHQCRSGGSGGASVQKWREWGCISGEVESMQGCISAEVEGVGVHQCRSGGSGGASVQKWREWGCISAEVEGVGVHQCRSGGSGGASVQKWRAGVHQCSESVHEQCTWTYISTHPFRLGRLTEEQVTSFYQFMKVHGLAFLC